jgi:hypothetical protein
MSSEFLPQRGTEDTERERKSGYQGIRLSGEREVGHERHEGEKGVKVQEHKNRGREGILCPESGNGGGDFLSKISVNSFGSV